VNFNQNIFKYQLFIVSLLLKIKLSMKAKLNKIDNDNAIVNWSDDEQFGNITFRFENNNYIVDTELLGLESLIKIIKALPEEIKNGELNENGLLVYKHMTNKHLFLQRSYRWKDSILLMDESNGRQIIQGFKYSTFDLSGWELITKEEYDKVEKKYTDIYK